MRWLASSIAVCIAATFLVARQEPASASSCPDGSAPSAGDGLICIPVSDPGDPSDDVKAKPHSGPRVCTSKGKKVPCNWAGGTWNGRGCYLIPTIQPPAGSSEWGGHDPSQGRLAACDSPGFGTPSYVFIPGTGAVDPGSLAQSALDQLPLTVPDIQTAPSGPGMTYVGLQTWLWIPKAQWHTLTKRVSVGGTSVEVTAEPRSIAWDLGPGSTTCAGPGREWISGTMSDSDSTDCGYTYTQVSDFEPNGSFEITAAISFRVDWTCSGACAQDEGSLGEVTGLPGAASLRVGERQSVNTTPGSE